MIVSATYDVQMQFSGSAGAWTSVEADVILTTPITCSYGIRGTGPTDRVSSTGTFNFALDNSADNSGGKLGYYSPGGPNCRAGFELGIGVRAALTYSGSTFYKFVGTLDDVSVVPAVQGPRQVYCTAVDWIDEANKQKIRLISTQVNQRGDQLVATVIGAMTRKPAASSLAAGDDVFPYAIDNNRDALDSPTTVFQNIAQSELGYITLEGDTVTGGVLTFTDRHGRPASGSALGSFSDTMVAMQPRRSRAVIYNDVQTMVHPRTVDSAASILFTLGQSQVIKAGTCLPILGNYTFPVGNTLQAGLFAACNTVQPTDYALNSASDGSGLDYSTAIASPAASYGGNSFKLNWYNSLNIDLWITRLQVRGRGLYNFQPITLESIDTNSTSAYGLNTLTFDMPYQTDAAGTGKSAADYMLQVWGQPMTRIESVAFVGNNSDALMKAGLQREPNDRVTLVETVSGINGDYYIQGVDWSIDGASTFNFSWLVVPTDPFASWLIGVVGSSEIGTTTRVGY